MAQHELDIVRFVVDNQARVFWVNKIECFCSVDYYSSFSMDVIKDAIGLPVCDKDKSAVFKKLIEIEEKRIAECRNEAKVDPAGNR